jgi:hypothetical protein
LTITAQEMLDRIREDYLNEPDEMKKELLLKDIITIHSHYQRYYFEDMSKDLKKKISGGLNEKF